VLSGALDDGTAGLVAIKQRGGIAVVQDPAEAIVGDMPRSALQNVEVDHVLPVAEIGALVARLATEKVDAPEPPPKPLLEREALITLNGGTVDLEPPPGEPSQFSCPACGGVLNEIHDGDLLRFRCQVGHGYGSEALRSAQQQEFEGALWAALRALEEQAALCRRLAVRARELSQAHNAERFDERALAAEQQARLVRDALRRGLGVSTEMDDSDDSSRPL
jgi:two-component system chemotaxis response regulator CheB